MKNIFMIVIFLLSLIISIVNSETLGESPEDNDIIALYNNILIGELFPSGNVFLERFSLDGGFDNEVNKGRLNH